MGNKKCENCNGTGCVICPKCNGEDLGEHKKCNCYRSPFNSNPCGNGYIQCYVCNGKKEKR